MKQHTPGPWHTGARHDLTIYTKDGMPIGDARHMGNKIAIEEMQANACLFVAAPDLLEALELIRELQLGTFNYLPDDEWEQKRNNVMRDVTAAVAKARGEERAR